MTNNQTDFIVFYSWQSDLPGATNRYAIKTALSIACSNLEAELSEVGIRIIIDEATRGEPGSPNIPFTILEKIKSSDAFVGDITTINQEVSKGKRRTPNPNVLFELGYAVAHLGWGRIVMLFNTEFGSFPEEAPFDIDRHRTSIYKFKAGIKGVAEAKALSELLTVALRAIINNPTPKPTSQRELTPDEVRRQRDIVNLKWVMATLHIPTLDEFILETPHLIYGHAFHFWESFNSVMTSGLFHLYDEEAHNFLIQMHESWCQCVSHGEQYRSRDGNIYVFGNRGDAPMDEEQQKAWDAIIEARPKLRSSLNGLLELIREKYLEIDISEMSRNAWNEYIDFQREFTKGVAK